MRPSTETLSVGPASYLSAPRYRNGLMAFSVENALDTLSRDGCCTGQVAHPRGNHLCAESCTADGRMEGVGRGEGSVYHNDVQADRGSIARGWFCPYRAT